MDQESGDWFLSGKVDLDRVGVFGHSTGGGAAVEFCLVDERCQAILGMDVWVEPVETEILELHLTQPALIMHSEDWYSPNEPDRNYELIGTLAKRAESDVDEIVLSGTRHYDFSSLPLLTPLAAQLGLKGPIPGTLGLEIINAETVAFFDKYLKGNKSISLEEISNQYPEVLWGARP
jgi:acetyl esterase/lipase